MPTFYKIPVIGGRTPDSFILVQDKTCRICRKQEATLAFKELALCNFCYASNKADIEQRHKELVKEWWLAHP